MQLDDPQLVIDAIRQVVEAAAGTTQSYRHQGTRPPPQFIAVAFLLD